jgi:putative ABC transport system permease protein
LLKPQTKPDLIKPRWSKVIADLWNTKMRTILVVASIAAGVFAIGMIATSYAILSTDVNLSYASINPPNIEIWTEPFQENFLPGIEQIPGVKEAEGRMIVNVRTSKNGVDWQDQPLIGVDDLRTMKIRLLDTLEGAKYPQQDEFIVSQSFMKKTGYQVGDEIIVEFPEGTSHTLTMIGIVIDQDSLGDPTGGATAFASMDTFESYGYPITYNRLYVTVIDGADDDLIASVAALVEDKIERSHRTVIRTELKRTDEHPMESMALAIFGVLGALGGLVTILSASLIINTLNAMLAQQLRQIGVMKLIGGRSRQILGMYLLLIFAYGLLALVISAPSGKAAGIGLARFIAKMMDVKLQSHAFFPWVIILQALIAFLIPIGAGFFPIRNGSKINVRRAISNDRPISQPDGFGLLNRIARWLPWISRPVLLSIRNTFRQKGRLTLTIFTLTIAGAIFIAVFNVRASMSLFMTQLSQHFMGDITLNFSQPYLIQRVENTLSAIPEIEDLEGWGGTTAEILDQDDEQLAKLQIIAPPADTDLLEADIVAGRWLLAGETRALVVSDSIYSDFPDLMPGDQIRLKITGKRAETWTVVGVFRYVSMMGNLLAYANYDYIACLTGTQNKASSYRLVTTEHTLESQLATIQALDQYLGDQGLQVSNIDSGLVLLESSGQMVTILIAFLLIMAVLIAFVGSIGLTGTMGMNVLERTREIGVMRAIGAVDFEIIKSVVIEAMMIGLITWVLAIGISFPISFLLLRIITASMMGSSMAVTFTPLGIYIWLAVVILLSIIASLVPARNAARLTINEVLSYE